MLDYIIARGKEPSTAAGLAVILTFVHVPDAMASAIINVLTAALGLLAVVRAEKAKG